MNADAPRIDDNDPVHQLAAELVWWAQDLQSRLRLQALPPIAYQCADEVHDRASRIRDYLEAIRATMAQPAAPEDDTEDNPFEGSDTATVKPAQDLHPYNRGGGSNRGRPKGGA